MLATIDEVNALDPNGSALEGDGIANNLTTPLDPSTLFVDYAAHNYHLANGSSAIGAGIDPASAGLGVTTDSEGTTRLGFDIGAYEYKETP